MHTKSMKQQGPMSPLQRKNSLRDNPVRSKSPKKVNNKTLKESPEEKPNTSKNEQQYPTPSGI